MTTDTDWNITLRLKATMGRFCNGTRYRVTVAACDRDREAWRTIVVVEFEGALPKDDEGLVDEKGVLAEISRDTGFVWQMEGGSGEGRPFANEPWLQYFGQLLVITQHGGLDV